MSYYRTIALATGLLLAASVPLSSHAADRVLTAFEPCTPNGVPAPLTGKAQCATLSVPEDRAASRGRVLTLPIVRFPAKNPGRDEPVFVLNGGPGGSNLRFTPLVQVNDTRDVYYVGYRGADGSTVLECPEVAARLAVPQVLSSANRQAVASAVGDCARRLQDSGVDLTRYTILDVIDDLESARSALGYDRIDLFSMSYGTRVAQYYARRHPERIFRSVMAGTNPPGHFVFDAGENDRILAHLARLCAADAGCASRTGDLRKTVLNTLHAGARSNDPQIDDGMTQVALFMSMYSRDSFSTFLDAAIAAERGDNSGLQRGAKLATDGLHTFIFGDLMAKGVMDSHGYAAKHATFAATSESMGSPVDLLYQALTPRWPAGPMPDEYHRAVDDPTQTLVINGDIDVATPLAFVQRELMPHLPNGKLLVLPDYGHGDFRRQGPAIDRIMATYYASGQLDASALAPDPYVFRD